MVKAFVVGYGSIGRRHKEVLQSLGCSVSIITSQTISETTTYRSMEEALANDEPDFVVIANHTAGHKSVLESLIHHGYKGKVLVEKPLFADFEPLPAHEFRSAHVGYNLRLHPLLQKLFRIVQTETAICCNVRAGQYLPEWRPNADYRMSYSAKRNEGGGVLRDLSHELDYLSWWFGLHTAVYARGGKFSQLDINSDDIYLLQLEFERCPLVSVQLDYLSRPIVRSIVVHTTTDTYCCDLIAGVLRKNGQIVSEVKIEKNETYRRMHQHILDGKTNDLCTFEQATNVLSLIEEAESVAQG